MRLKEQKLWDTMKRWKPAEFWLQRVENICVEGMPDLYCAADKQCWVELKAVTRPKRSGTRLLGDEGLRPAQINWHVKAASKGVASYVLVRDDQGYLYLLPGAAAADLNDMPRGGVEELSLAHDWAAIYRELK